MALYQKGQSGNLNGRPKGSQNVATRKAREVIKSIFDRNADKFDEYLEALEPKDKLDFFIKLLPYLVPKATEDGVENSTQKIEIVVSDETTAMLLKGLKK